ncbi:MAG: hypothetical protein IJF78_02250 [Clostridia bacterium]|nr:hypothetical protein [Clostridia bacterium]
METKHNLGKEQQADVTVLVSSCDKYADAWDPFFRLIHLYWNNCPYPIVLNTEQKKYVCDYMNVQVINSDLGLAWGQRLLNVVSQIQSEYVFLLLEDFFLDAPFNAEMFEKVLEYMNAHKNIGVTHITQSHKPHEDTEDLLWERNYERLNIVVTATLYRKDFLMKILRSNESPWEFEHYAGIRARRMKEHIMQYNEKYPVIYSYNHSLFDGTAITNGKWMKNTQYLFEKHGIKVDYNNLGVYPSSEHIERPIVVNNKKMVKPSGLVEGSYYYWKRIKRLPAKINEWWYHIR